MISGNKCLGNTRDAHETNVVIIMHLHTRAEERMSQAQYGPHCPHPGGSDNVFGCAEAKMKIPAVQRFSTCP